MSGETKTTLDLKPCANYTVQVRRSSLSDPPLWSSWSESHHIFLDGKNCSRDLQMLTVKLTLLILVLSHLLAVWEIQNIENETSQFQILNPYGWVDLINLIDAVPFFSWRSKRVFIPNSWLISSKRSVRPGQTIITFNYLSGRFMPVVNY